MLVSTCGLGGRSCPFIGTGCLSLSSLVGGLTIAAATDPWIEVHADGCTFDEREEPAGVPAAVLEDDRLPCGERLLVNGLPAADEVFAAFVEDDAVLAAPGYRRRAFRADIWSWKMRTLRQFTSGSSSFCRDSEYITRSVFVHRFSKTLSAHSHSRMSRQNRWSHPRVNS